MKFWVDTLEIMIPSISKKDLLAFYIRNPVSFKDGSLDLSLKPFDPLIFQELGDDLPSIEDLIEDDRIVAYDWFNGKLLFSSQSFLLPEKIDSIHIRGFFNVQFGELNHYSSYGGELEYRIGVGNLDQEEEQHLYSNLRHHVMMQCRDRIEESEFFDLNYFSGIKPNEDAEKRDFHLIPSSIFKKYLLSLNEKQVFDLSSSVQLIKRFTEFSNFFQITIESLGSFHNLISQGDQSFISVGKDGTLIIIVRDIDLDTVREFFDNKKEACIDDSLIQDSTSYYDFLIGEIRVFDDIFEGRHLGHSL